MRLLISLLIVCLLLVACDDTNTLPTDVPTPVVTEAPTGVPVDPTPTQEAECGLLGCQFEDMTINPNLRNWSVIDVDPHPEIVAEQSVPAGYYVYNKLSNIDGQHSDHTGYAPVAHDGYGHEVIIDAWAGEFGYSQDKHITNSGCYILKMDAAHIITDELFPGDHQYNYGLRGLIQRRGQIDPLAFDRVTFVNLDGQKDYLIGAVWIENAGDITVTWSVSVAYPTGYGWIRIDAVGFGRDTAPPESDHCNESAPSI